MANNLKRYRRKAGTIVTAVQLDLETDGFTYQKWGGAQRCKAGDWIVNNQLDTHTVDGESFDRTYRMVSPGRYEKHGFVWAEPAPYTGKIETKEGFSAYDEGDWLVYNEADRTDGYAIKSKRFHSLYEEAGD